MAFTAGSGGEGRTSTGTSIEIDGQRVPLNQAGLERAQAKHGNVGEKIVESVRQAVEQATDGEG
jgi:hypothetical protein